MLLDIYILGYLVSLLFMFFEYNRFHVYVIRGITFSDPTEVKMFRIGCDLVAAILITFWPLLVLYIYARKLLFGKDSK